MTKIKHFINIATITLSALLALGACTIRTFSNETNNSSISPVSSAENNQSSADNTSSNESQASSQEQASSNNPVSSSEAPASSSEAPSSSEVISSSEEPVVTLESIEVINNQESYEVGDSLNLTVIAHYSDGTSMALNEFDVSGFDNQVSGPQTVTVSFENKSATVNVFVNPIVLPNLFPADALVEFLEDNSIVLEVPSPVGYQEWENANIIDEEKMPTFYAYTNDTGTVGTDSIQDAYLEVLSADSSWTISALDGYQYAVKENVKIQYRTNANKFSFYVHVLDLDPSSSANFPMTQLVAFLNDESLTAVPPAATSSARWHYETGTDGELGNYFYTVTEDKGTTPGTNAIEDSYKALLEGEWDIDDTSYSQNGYYATKDDVIINFYSAEEHFVFIASKYETPELPITDQFGEWRLVTDASSLQDGDHVVIGEKSHSVVAGQFSSNYMEAITNVTFEDNAIKDLPSEAMQFVLRKESDHWYFVNYKSKLGSTAVRKIGLDTGNINWFISIDSDGASIANGTTANGKIAYNTSMKYFTTYTAFTSSRVLPQLYKFVELVPTYPTAITITGAENSVQVGKSINLSINYTPSDTNINKDVVWESSNNNVATVDSNGVVTGVSEGVVTIYATGKNQNNEDIVASYQVSVTPTLKDAWTIMMYVCGADLESENGLASGDIDEILKVKNQPEDINIILQTGGAKSWTNSNISASNLGRFHIENRQLVKDATVSKASMGKQSTLTSFLNWGFENYPADKMGIIFWNHGGGITGVCFDENYDNDSLSSSETSAAFANTFDANGIEGKLEFVGYDACLMQLQDVATFNSEYFNYMVTSQEAESGYGWDYDTWVDNLYAYDSTLNILKAICDGFISSTDSAYGGHAYNDQTQSVLDLSKIYDYYEAFENVASAISSKAKSNSNNFKNLLATAKDYGDMYISATEYNSWINSGAPSSWFSYYGQGYYIMEGAWFYGELDAYDVLTKLANSSDYSSYASLINTAKSALTQVVVYNKIGGAAGESHGLSLNALMSYYCSYPSTETHFNNWRNIFR